MRVSQTITNAPMSQAASVLPSDDELNARRAAVGESSSRPHGKRPGGLPAKPGIRGNATAAITRTPAAIHAGATEARGPSTRLLSTGETRAVTFVQRFDSTLGGLLHLHVPGAGWRLHPCGRRRFRRVSRGRRAHASRHRGRRRARREAHASLVMPLNDAIEHGVMRPLGNIFDRRSKG